MLNQQKKTENQNNSWVQERRAGNIRIVLCLVAFCTVIMLFSAWSFIRFMEIRTGYERESAQQTPS